MKKLRDLLNQGSLNGLRVRYVDWNHRIRYFQVEKLDSDGRVHGQLDDGEAMHFASESDFWRLYNEGDENSAKAV